MGRRITTHFNPALGLLYIVKNLKTEKTVVGKTLTPKYKQHLPIRSSKNTPIGEEFFKMLIDEKVYKFLNSNKYEKCLSEDGTWEFIGMRPDGKRLETRRNKKKNTNIMNEDELEFVSDELYELIG